MDKPGASALSRPAWRRSLPLAVLALAVGAFFATGLHRSVSFDALALAYGHLTGWSAENPVIALLATAGIYMVATAVFFPAAWLLTVAAGLVLGWLAGTVAVVTGATAGAVLLFLATRLALADFFRARASGALTRMADGFRKDAASYMLFLRLAAVFPFWLVNVVPAILGVPLRTFGWTTLVGIIPGTVAYAFAGEGLRSIIGDRAQACLDNVAPCGEALSPRDLVTTEILIAFALLALVSLLPVALKWFRRKRHLQP